jgi:hypothetical protein
MIRLLHRWDGLRGSFWFLPSLMERRRSPAPASPSTAQRVEKPCPLSGPRQRSWFRS